MTSGVSAWNGVSPMSDPASGFEAGTVVSALDGASIVVWAELDPDTGRIVIKGKLVTLDGEILRDTFVIDSSLAPSPSNGSWYDPSVTALSDGRFVVTYNSSNGQAVQTILDASGTVTTAAMPLNNLMFGAAQDVLSVSIGSGGHVAVWSAIGSTAETADIWRQVFDANGQPVGSAVVVNDEPIVLSTAEVLNPAVTTLADGRAVIAFSFLATNEETDVQTRGVAYRILQADGSLGPQRTLPSVTADPQDVSVTALANGSLAFAWSDSARVHLQVVKADGTTAFVNHNVSQTFTGVALAQVAALPDGRLIVAWVKTGFDGTKTVEAKIFEADGTFGPVFTVVDGIAVTGEPSLDLVTHEDGRFTVTWNDGGTVKSQTWDTRDPAGVNWSGTGGNNNYAGTVGADTLFSGAGNDRIAGYFGDDTLNGGSGNDTLIGGNGNDLLTGSIGADKLVGGEGLDTADYSLPSDITLPSYVGVTVNLTTGVGQGGDAEGDQLTGIEHVNGSAFDDVLIGDGASNILTGNDGRDSLSGGDGADTLRGGNGADTLLGGAGADTMDGGIDGDLYYIDHSGDVVIEDTDLLDGEDTIVSSIDYVLADNVHVEVLMATDGVDNSLTGNSGDNVVIGGDGANTLDGGAGRDILEGHEGDDSLIGGLGSDILMGGTGADTMVGGTGNDLYIVHDATDMVIEAVDGGGSADAIETWIDYVLAEDVGVEQLWASYNGADLKLTGNSRANLLYGNTGNNVLNGGGGADMLDGGGGIDTADYSTSGASVIVNLETGLGQGGDAEGDQLSGMEFINGSAFADVLIGDGADNLLMGNGGEDVLDGGLGADTLDGGAGIDTLMGRAGNDLYHVDNARDVVIELQNGGTDTVVSGVNYILAAGVEVEVLLAADNGADLKLTGNAFDNTIKGNDGANVLRGGVGNDTLEGGVGNDTLNGGPGADVLNGGAGNDVLVSGRAAGSSQLIGGFGNDTYYLNGKGDTVAFDTGGINDTAFIYTMNFNTIAERDAFEAHLKNNLGIENVIIDSTDHGPGENLPTDLALSSAWAREGTKDGFTIGSLSTVDLDQGDTFTYRLLDDAGGRFKLVGDLLQVADGTLLDFEQAGSHQILVEVTDFAQNTFVKILTVNVRDWVNEVITGTARNDLFKGGTGDDVLKGGGGNDTLIGGNGSDVLTGGAGSDVFVFDTAPQASRFDTVVDYTTGEDVIRLKGDQFGLATLGTRPLSAAEFGLGSKATTAEQRILYDVGTGTLYYDADGSGTAAAAVKVAVFATKPALSAASFFVI